MAIKTDMQKKEKNYKKKKGKVSFEEEVINKDKATEVLTKLPIKLELPNENENETIERKKAKKRRKDNNIENEDNLELSVPKKKKKKHKQTDNDQTDDDSKQVEESIESIEDIKESKIKKKKKVKREKDDDSKQVQESTESIDDIKEGKVKKEKDDDFKQIQKSTESINDMKEGKVKKKKKEKKEQNEELPEQELSEGQTVKPDKESKRAIKKKKHLELQAEKKLKATLVTQENVLNYLSKWKHSRSDWKFEKLKQIWLSHSLFDSAKIPDEFWEITLQYFSDSRGFIRKLIIREALKIVEEDTLEEENIDEEYRCKLRRARDIVQNLQE